MPADQVDPLTVQLLDDVLDPTPTNPHAGADAIDAGIMAGEGELAPNPRPAGDRFDLDDAVRDFGNLTGKEAGDDIGFVVRHRSAPGKVRWASPNSAHLSDSGFG